MIAYTTTIKNYTEGIEGYNFIADAYEIIPHIKFINSEENVMEELFYDDNGQLKLKLYPHPIVLVGNTDNEQFTTLENILLCKDTVGKITPKFVCVQGQEVLSALKEAQAKGIPTERYEVNFVLFTNENAARYLNSL